MTRHHISDKLWSKLAPWFASRVRDPRGAKSKTPDRVILDGLLWLMKTGSPWRDLPPEYGSWQTVYRRYRQWIQEGIWESIFAELSKDCDSESFMIDGSIVKVHQAGTGAKGGTLIRR